MSADKNQDTPGRGRSATQKLNNALQECKRDSLHARTQLPPVVIGEEGENVGHAAERSLRLLGQSCSVFRFNTSMVEVVDDSPPRIVPVVPARARALLTQHVATYRPARKPDSRTGVRASLIAPPNLLVDALLAHPVKPGVRILDALLHAPTILPDGTIRSDPGYHEPSRTYLVSDVNVRDVGDPSKQQAEDALTRLETIFEEFLFLEECEEFGATTLLSGLLTAVAAPGCGFKAPLLAVSAVDKNAGKSTAVAFMSAIALGRGFPDVTIPSARNAREMSDKLRAQIEAFLQGGEQFFYVDNWPNGLPFGDANVAKSITSHERTVRPYHQNQRVEHVTDRLIWILTSNNFQMTREADLNRRTLLVQLVPRGPDFKYRLGDTDDAIAQLLSRRAELLGDALTVLRAHALAGYPKSKEHHPLPSFGAWDRVVRSALLWLGRPDVALACDYAKQYYRDNTEGNLIEFLREWWWLHRDRPVTLRELVAVPSNASEDRVRGVMYLLRALRAFYADAVLMDRTKTEPVGLDAQKLTSALQKYDGRPSGLGPFTLRRTGRKRGNAVVWVLRASDPDAAMPDREEEYEGELQGIEGGKSEGEEVPY